MQTYIQKIHKNKSIDSFKKTYYHWDNNRLVLRLYIKTSSRCDEVIGAYQDRLKVAVTSSPIDGKANKHLIKFLADYFGVPQNQVEIKSGASSKYKSVIIYNPKKHLNKF